MDANRWIFTSIVDCDLNCPYAEDNIDDQCDPGWYGIIYTIYCKIYPCNPTIPSHQINMLLECSRMLSWQAAPEYAGIDRLVHLAEETYILVTETIYTIMTK